MVTVRTLGKRPDDRSLGGYAENADIEETADDGAENKGKTVKKQKHGEPFLKILISQYQGD